MNLLATQRGRKLLFTALYASEGAPIGYIWWAFPTKLRDAGVPIDQVTHLTAVLTLPWAFKFLWAPLVDTIRTESFGLRSWIVTSQLAMGLVLLPLLGMPLDGQWDLLMPLLFVHALLAATQDASVDALCIASVPEHQRGALNGWMQAGMLGGRAVFGGVALRAEAYWGANVVLVGLLCCVWFSTVLVVCCCETPGAESQRHIDRRIMRRFAETLKSALRSRRTWLGLTFAALGGAAFEAAGALVGPMLIDAGVAKERVGDFFAFPVVLALGAGALAGGALSDRIGRVRTVAGMLVGIAGMVTIMAFAYRTAIASTLPLVATASLLYVLIGAFTASSYALFMDLTEPELGATQFSAFMGATNLCEVWAGLVAGRLASRLDYAAALWILVPVSLLTLFILRQLARIERNQIPAASVS